MVVLGIVVAELAVVVELFVVKVLDVAAELLVVTALGVTTELAVVAELSVDIVGATSVSDESVEILDKILRVVEVRGHHVV